MDLKALIAKLQADVTATKAGEASAIALIKGIPALIAAAVAQAQAQGATPEQLQALSDLSTQLEGSAADLGAAVVAAGAPDPVQQPAGQA